MFSKNLALIVLAVFASGCGLQFHTYVMTKPRVGLDQSGNGGCIMGKCSAPPPPTETTRKVYVLEISKPLPQSEVQKVEQKIASATPSPSDLQVPAEPTPQPVAAVPQDTEPKIVIPPIDDETAPTPAAPAVAAPAAQVSSGPSVEQTYTVQKDDTLQKIAKKVYGTYGKWYQIYKANKDKIKNPNFVKPGTVLTIPAATK